jgi:enoyl-CoA hydratase
MVVEDHIARVTIDNPPINALHPVVADEINECLTAITENQSIRVVILTGSGSHFVGGADLHYVRELDSRQAESYVLGIQAMQDSVRTLRQPVIAAINGSALGGGAELALACDLRISEEQAIFGFPEVTLGLIPGAGGTQNLPRLIALGRAKRMIFTGERISADEALSIGLVDEVVPSGEALVGAQRLAVSIARNAPRAVAAAKRAMDLGADAGLVEGHRIEAALFGPLVESDDFAEGTAAFFEKRPPTFNGN